MLSDLAPEDFRVNISESFDLSSDEDAAVSYYCPEGVDGMVYIYLNNTYQYSYYIDDSDVGHIVDVTSFDDVSPGTYNVSVTYEPNSGETLKLKEGTLIITNIITKDDFEIIWNDEVYYVNGYVLNVWDAPVDGTLVVSVRGTERYSKAMTDMDDIFVYLNDLNITENGNYLISAKYITSDDEIDLGNENVSVDVDWNQDGYIYIDSYVDILYHEGSFISVDDDVEYIVGTVSVYIGGNLKLSKKYTANDKKHHVYFTVDDLNLYDNIALGNATVKVVYMKNDAEEHVSEKVVEFYAEPSYDSYYEISVGEKESIVVTYIKGSTGTLTLYNAVKKASEYDPEDYKLEKGTLIKSSNFVNGVATIPFDSLAKGEHTFILNIAVGKFNEDREIHVLVKDNSPEFSASVSPSEITVGSNVVVNFNGPVSTKKVIVYVDDKEFKSVVLSTGTLSETVSGLSVGQHKIGVKFEDEDKDLFYSNTFYVTVKQKVTPPTPSAPDKISLTLKKVKVKKSAKKLVLKSTLKINNKAKKGLKVVFKFNGKKFTAKTNKKGVAKATIKKKVLKKLKVGKKVTYQVSYGKTVKKVSVKVKK